MTDQKEPHHFGQDLWVRNYDFYARFGERDAYLKLFEHHKNERRVGEASVWYLSSRSAAQEIHQFNPNARIIVNLRHPVDMLYSLHGRAMLGGDEPVTDFVEAMRLSNQERETSRYGLTRRFKHGFCYQSAVDFSTQIERYLHLFGRDQVHFVLFDDIRTDVGEAYKKVLESPSE